MLNPYIYELPTDQIVSAPMQTSLVYGGDAGYSMPNLASNTNEHRITLGGSPSIAIGSNGRYYDSSSNYDTITDSDTLSFTNGSSDLAFSGSIRIDISALAGGTTGMLFGKVSGSGYEYALVLRNDYLVLYQMDAPATNQLNTKVPLTAASVLANTLTVGFTSDGSKTNAGVNLYINGVNQTVGKISENYGTYQGMVNTTSPIYFGRWPVGSIWGITGYLKNFHLDKGVNTAAEMLAYHNEI